MYKMEHVLWRGVLTVITAAAMFVLLYRYTCAEEIAGEEVYFTHTHAAGCKALQSVSCPNTHGFYYHTSDSGTFHCQTCGAQTHHILQMDVYRCSQTGDTWQENAYNQCSVCGTIKTRWGGSPGLHYYNIEKNNCGFSEGERTVGIQITANGAWTNQGVVLTAKQTIWKDDKAGDIAFDWAGGSLLAAENGVYTVNARNGAGDCVTASITVSCIDRTQPVILSVSGDTQSMTASGISIFVAASDKESGLADTPYSFDGGATWTAEASCWLENGREISLCVRDKAGNISGKSIKRSDFPYPPPAPTPAPQAPAPTFVPTPAPAAPQSTPVPSLSDPNADGKSQNGNGQTAGGQKDKNGGTFSDKGNAAAKSQSAGTNEVAEGGKAGSGRDIAEQGARYRGGSFRQIKLQPAILKEGLGEDCSGSGFRVVRMDKAKAADMRKAGEEAMADYMQAVVLGGGDRYALKSSLPAAAAKRSAMEQVVSRIKEHAGLAAGIILFCIGLLWCCRAVWLYTAELYCYDAGNTYRRLGILPIKKRKKELELYLPDDMLAKTGIPRYRLVVKSGLIKRFGKMDLVVYSDAYSLRRPLEECVDFVL